MGPKRWIALGVVAIVGTLMIGVSSTWALKCTAQGNCSESGEIQMPANGLGTQQTDRVPADSTQGNIVVEPLKPDEVATLDKGWESVVAGYPKLNGIKNVFVRRVLTCAFAVPELNARLNEADPNDLGPPEPDADYGQVLLTMCVHLAYSASHLAHPASHSAAVGCFLRFGSVPIQIKKVGGKYVARAAGSAKQVSGGASLAVSCRRQGSGRRIGVHPRARGRKLRQIIGPHLRVGFVNPTTSSVTIHSVFSFSR